MSQKVQIRADGCAYPVIVCDHCAKIIADVTDGNTVWRGAMPGRGRERFFDVQHTHKHCNSDFMDVRFPEPADGSWCWMSHELRHDLFMLLRNTNYDAREAEWHAKLMAMCE
jgi:hypothetical protein